jgi:hypothetical protein
MVVATAYGGEGKMAAAEEEEAVDMMTKPRCCRRCA